MGAKPAFLHSENGFLDPENEVWHSENEFLDLENEFPRLENNILNAENGFLNPKPEIPSPEYDFLDSDSDNLDAESGFLDADSRHPDSENGFLHPINEVSEPESRFPNADHRVADFNRGPGALQDYQKEWAVIGMAHPGDVPTIGPCASALTHFCLPRRLRTRAQNFSRVSKNGDLIRWKFQLKTRRTLIPFSSKQN